jgi:hypothetical protein
MQNQYYFILENKAWRRYTPVVASDGEYTRNSGARKRPQYNVIEEEILASVHSRYLDLEE